MARCEGSHELEAGITLEEALEFHILFYGVSKPLGWIACNHPLYLERVMSLFEPGTKEFYAVVLVYDYFEDILRVATNTPRVSGTHGSQSKHRRVPQQTQTRMVVEKHRPTEAHDPQL